MDGAADRDARATARRRLQCMPGERPETSHGAHPRARPRRFPRRQSARRAVSRQGRTKTAPAGADETLLDRQKTPPAEAPERSFRRPLAAARYPPPREGKDRDEAAPP